LKLLYNQISEDEILLFKLLGLKHFLNSRLDARILYTGMYDLYRVKIDEIHNNYNNYNNDEKKEADINLILYKTMITIIKDVYMKGIVKRNTFKFTDIFEDLLNMVKEIYPEEYTNYLEQVELRKEKEKIRKGIKR
jgi:hypothetical protein